MSPDPPSLLQATEARKLARSQVAVSGQSDPHLTPQPEARLDTRRPMSYPPRPRSHLSLARASQACPLASLPGLSSQELTSKPPSSAPLSLCPPGLGASNRQGPCWGSVWVHDQRG